MLMQLVSLPLFPLFHIFLLLCFLVLVLVLALEFKLQLMLMFRFYFVKSSYDLNNDLNHASFSLRVLSISFRIISKKTIEILIFVILYNVNI